MKRKTKTILLFLVILAIIYISWLALGPIRYIYSAGRKIPQSVAEIKSYIQNNDYLSANIYINQTEDNIAVIRENLKYIHFIKIIPVLGEKFSQTEKMLNDAQVICINSSKIIQSLSELGEINKATLLSALSNYPEEVKNLIQSLQSLSNNAILLADIFKITDSQSIDSIGFISKLLKIIKPLENHLFQILGYSGEQRYLLLFQNNTELRPTGGFIGTYGILEMDKGKIKNLFIDDIYHLDSRVIGQLNNEVPAPLKKYLKTEEWYLRDCNWNADFSTAAQDCLYLYEIESQDPKKIDGVITLTPLVVASIFEIIGAQEVGGVLFESENFTSDLQKAVELYYQERGVTHWERKNIISALAQVIIDCFQYLNIEDYQNVIDVVLQGLEKKDILLYSQNSNLQILLSQSNWTGEILDMNTDYIMVVDSNLASFKSDQYIDRNYYYNLNKNDQDELIVTLTLEYDHQGNFSWNSTRYRTYTRVFAPIGSELIEIIGAMDNDRSFKQGEVDVYSEYNKQVFAAFIAIEPNQKKILTFKYKLPDRIKKQIENKQYQIYLQKQPGVQNLEYILSVDLEENFSNYQVNSMEILEDNLSSFAGKINLEKDTLIQITW